MSHIFFMGGKTFLTSDDAYYNLVQFRKLKFRGTNFMQLPTFGEGSGL